jgi:hypothetical protein
MVPVALKILPPYLSIHMKNVKKRSPDAILASVLV